MVQARPVLVAPEFPSRYNSSMQTILNFLQQGLIYVVACVILLGILVFVHELGHFLVARWCGVRVEVFSLGFGRKIWKKVVGDTTYCVSVIPLGGYVKMYGEQPGDAIAPEMQKVSFTHKTVWQRIAIVLAGPLMNLFFAAVLFAVVAMTGTEMRSPVLGDVPADSVAGQAGFKSGDRILAVDGRGIATFEDFSEAMNDGIGRSMSFKVTREGGATEEFSAVVTSRENPNPLSLRDQVGEIAGLSGLSMASIVGVPATSPLHALGLRSGDRIVAVGDRPVTMFRQLETAFAAAPAGPLDLKIEREDAATGATEKLDLTFASAERGIAKLGLESPELYLDKVLPGSPAQAAGLMHGDRLLSFDGKAVSRWEDVLETIRSYKGGRGVDVEFLRDGQKKSVSIEPQMTSQMTAFGSEDKRFTIGIMPRVEAAMPETVIVRTLNPALALVQGAKQSWDFSVITVLSFVRLFQSKISPKTVGGLLSIGQAAGETMKMGFTKFLTMMAILSINLFVLNLLPVPVLDGGHLVFYTIEAVKGSPLSMRKMEIAQQVGLVMLMGLMVFALFNDVTRLIFGRL